MPFSLFSTAHLWSYRRSVFLCFLIEIRETLSFSKPDPIYSWIFLSQIHFSNRHPPLMITHEFYSGRIFSLMNPLMIFTRATHDYSWNTRLTFLGCDNRWKTKVLYEFVSKNWKSIFDFVPGIDHFRHPESIYRYRKFKILRNFTKRRMTSKSMF